MMLSKNEVRMKRKTRIRKRLSGTSERPRLVVFRSNLHIYAQIIDDLFDFGSGFYVGSFQKRR